jgi:hypothetical protein
MATKFQERLEIKIFFINKKLTLPYGARGGAVG